MSRRSRFLLAAAALAALFAAGTAGAQSQRYNDPPSRVARISDMHGPISYSPAGDGEWYDAQRNRPLVGGDALWSDRGARAEVQAGSTWIRMDQDTSLSLVQLDDRMLQVEVTEGSVNLRVRRLYPGQRVEVDTPNLAFVIDRPGNFRLDVDREGDNTTIEARQGGGRVYGVGGRFDVRNGDVVVFYGQDVRDYEMYAFPAQDGFDRYLRMRDQRIDRSQSLRYLGDDLVGYSDLDDYGRWSRYPQYGNVWFPSNVYAGWAPYQDGQWVWQDPWGWTWVDDQPWGFAPSHYGRWAWVDGRWGWVPGPRTYRPVYAPALVAFLEVAGGSIGWFPLGPSDVYYPSYDVSSNYFRAVNISNTVVNASTVNNVYNSYGRANAVPLAQGAYRNRAVPTAVTAVPQDVFVNSRPVRQARRENRELSAATPPAGLQLRRTLGVRPGRAAVLGAAPQSNVRPPRAVEDEQVLAHNAAPTAVTPTATSTPAPVAPVRERARRVRQISDQQAATDARASGPRHQGESAAAATPPATPAATTPATATAPGGGRLQALDRDALPRVRGARRMQDRQPPAAPATPAPAAPAAAPAPAPAASAPTTAPAPAPAAQAPAPTPAAQSDAARQAEEARVAQQKAREEQRQAREAQQQAQQQQRESEDALRQAQQQRQQAQAASSDAVQQQQAADADAKAVQERQQARAAAQEAQRQQREAQQAQRDAAQQQAEAAQAAPKPAPAPATPATPAPEAAAAPAQRRDCVPQERIDAMRKRGVAEDRLAALKVCPAEPPVQQ